MEPDDSAATVASPLDDDVEDEAEDRVEDEDDGEAEDEPSVTDLLEELGREMSTLVFYEARLAAAQHKQEIRLAALGSGAVVGIVLVFFSAFALVNVAAVLALSSVVSDWLAALILAVAWSAVGAALALLLLARARTLAAWTVEDAEKASAEAEEAVRDTLERLSPAIAKEVATAALPVAGDVAEGVLDAGEDLLEGADELVDTITEDLPGGRVVNQILDVVLMPGRFGIRIATTVLKRSDSG
ncbi:MAG TPA: phage holin family protein [Gaiellaceae bacterium]|jgi:hypothetical protein